MLLVESIEKRTDFARDEDVMRAMSDMRNVSDMELMLFIVKGETLGQTKHSTRNCIALCRAEKERRDAVQVERLTMRSTRGAAAIGGVATLIGAIVGAFATYSVGQFGGEVPANAAVQISAKNPTVIESN